MIEELKKTLKKYVKKNSLLETIGRYLLGSNSRTIHWCRVVMDKSTEQLVLDLPFKNFSVLEVSGRNWANFDFQNYTSVQYPNFDICKDTLNEKYDMIIAEQVFEHVQKPHQAGINVFNHLKPGGYFLITTPFMIKIHPSPDDCYRWSKTGIKYFLEECGFDHVDSYSWGNKKCIKANLKSWVSYKPRWHSLRNEDRFPMVIWALARSSAK